jgi:hypothetical protein
MRAKGIACASLERQTAHKFSRSRHVPLKTSARFFPAVVALTLFAILGVTSAAAQENILYRFGSVANDGVFPTGTLIADKQGDLYGTTIVG